MTIQERLAKAENVQVVEQGNKLVAELTETRDGRIQITFPGEMDVENLVQTQTGVKFDVVLPDFFVKISDQGAAKQYRIRGGTKSFGLALKG